MIRYVVTLTNGERWALSTSDVAGAASRGVQSSARWGAGCERVQIVQTLEQYHAAGRATFVRELDALGAVVVGAVAP